MSSIAADRDATAESVVHGAVRYAAAITAAFVACEALQWTPTGLGGVFASVLLANLPVRPPLKVIVVLMLVMSLSAWAVYVLSSALRETPFILFGAVSLCMFLAFHALAGGQGGLQYMLLVISLTIIPVVELIAPTAGSHVAEALPRALAVGALMVTIAWVVWPIPAPRQPMPVTPPSEVPPLTRAVISTAVVLPVMLAYLLFGWADIMPVLIATVLIVLTFDPAGSRTEAWGRVIANFAGGLMGFLLHAVLMTTPSLAFLALLLFLVLLGVSRHVYRGGMEGRIAMVGCNGMLIILSSAIASGPSSLSLWLVRLFQFALAGAFAVGMMELLWHRVVRRPVWRRT
jgi:hypothetical protein